jgi:hypothetical protein
MIGGRRFAENPARLESINRQFHKISRGMLEIGQFFLKLEQCLDRVGGELLRSRGDGSLIKSATVLLPLV